MCDRPPVAWPLSISGHVEPTATRDLAVPTAPIRRCTERGAPTLADRPPAMIGLERPSVGRRQPTPASKPEDEWDSARGSSREEKIEMRPGERAGGLRTASRTSRGDLIHRWPSRLCLLRGPLPAAPGHLRILTSPLSSVFSPLCLLPLPCPLSSLRCPCPRPSIIWHARQSARNDMLATIFHAIRVHGPATGFASEKACRCHKFKAARSAPPGSCPSINGSPPKAVPKTSGS